MQRHVRMCGVGGPSVTGVGGVLCGCSPVVPLCARLRVTRPSHLRRLVDTGRAASRAEAAFLGELLRLNNVLHHVRCCAHGAVGHDVNVACAR